MRFSMLVVVGLALISAVVAPAAVSQELSAEGKANLALMQSLEAADDFMKEITNRGGTCVPPMRGNPVNMTAFCQTPPGDPNYNIMVMVRGVSTQAATSIACDDARRWLESRPWRPSLSLLVAQWMPNSNSAACMWADTSLRLPR